MYDMKTSQKVTENLCLKLRLEELNVRLLSVLTASNVCSVIFAVLHVLTSHFQVSPCTHSTLFADVQIWSWQRCMLGFPAAFKWSIGSETLKLAGQPVISVAFVSDASAAGRGPLHLLRLINLGSGQICLLSCWFQMWHFQDASDPFAKGVWSLPAALSSSSCVWSFLAVIISGAAALLVFPTCSAPLITAFLKGNPALVHPEQAAGKPSGLQVRVVSLMQQSITVNFTTQPEWS